MSQETQEWLDENVLVGFTDKRGKAWHYREGTDNHYVGAIPREDVESRLFHWTAETSPVEYTLRNGSARMSSERKVIYRSDTGDELGVFKNGYQPHQPKEWLLDQTEMIADSDLDIGSAGLLQGGGQAWVQFELPETLQAAEGVEFRPFINAATSFNGTIATTYFAGAQVIVCDNTLAAGLRNAFGQVKVRHSRHSLGRLSEVRDALGIVYQAADSFQAEVDALTASFVSDDEWSDFVKAYTLGTETTKRSENLAARKAGELQSLWTEDERVTPWKNTAFGVLQAVNTHVHHVQTVRNANRVERNMQRVVSGEVQSMDQATLDLLALVTHRELAVAA